MVAKQRSYVQPAWLLPGGASTPPPAGRPFRAAQEVSPARGISTPEASTTEGLDVVSAGQPGQRQQQQQVVTEPLSPNKEAGGEKGQEEEQEEEPAEEQPRALYLLRFVTSREPQSGGLDPHAGLLVSLIGENGKAVFWRVDPFDVAAEPAAAAEGAGAAAVGGGAGGVVPGPAGAVRERFQEGQVDVVKVVAADVGRVAALWIAPEAGTWRLDEASVTVFPIPSTSESETTDSENNAADADAQSAAAAGPSSSSSSPVAPAPSSTKRATNVVENVGGKGAGSSRSSQAGGGSSTAAGAAAAAAGVGSSGSANGGAAKAVKLPLASAAAIAAAAAEAEVEDCVTGAEPICASRGVSYVFRGDGPILLGESDDLPALEMRPVAVLDVEAAPGQGGELFPGAQAGGVASASPLEVLQRREAGLLEYRALKKWLLGTTAWLVGAGTATAWALVGDQSALGFAVGGAGALLYVLRLQSRVDGLARGAGGASAGGTPGGEEGLFDAGPSPPVAGGLAGPLQELIISDFTSPSGTPVGNGSSSSSGGSATAGGDEVEGAQVGAERAVSHAVDEDGHPVVSAAAATGGGPSSGAGDAGGAGVEAAAGGGVGQLSEGFQLALELLGGPAARLGVMLALVLVASTVAESVRPGGSLGGVSVPPSELLAGILGFLTYKVAVIMAAFRPSFSPLHTTLKE
eukprot:jgi/Mesen1/5331/ME000266S04522